jgi:hypothetical protein
MNLRVGGNTFWNVTVPVLWGQRAILQDKFGKLSVVDLSGPKPRVELLADEPAVGVEFRPILNGVALIQAGTTLYTFDKLEKTLSSVTLSLPEIQVTESSIRVGSLELVNNRIIGYGVGVAVSPTSVSIGAPLPAGLSELQP